jgi:predicted RNA binding protein YcfA (HicA-like mRNA interferase family)
VKQVSGKALARAVQRKGWSLARISGSHHIFVLAGRRERIVIPIHGNRSLKIGLYEYSAEPPIKPARSIGKKHLAGIFSIPLFVLRAGTPTWFSVVRSRIEFRGQSPGKGVRLNAYLDSIGRCGGVSIKPSTPRGLPVSRSNAAAPSGIKSSLSRSTCQLPDSCWFPWAPRCCSGCCLNLRERGSRAHYLFEEGEKDGGG